MLDKRRTQKIYCVGCAKFLQMQKDGSMVFENENENEQEPPPSAPQNKNEKTAPRDPPVEIPEQQKPSVPKYHTTTDRSKRAEEVERVCEPL